MINKFLTLIGIGFSLTALFALAGAKPPPADFQSPWLPIAPGESLSIAHPLAIQPRFVSVMVRQLVFVADVETIRPHTELPDRPLVIFDIDPAQITINNTSQAESYFIQVNLR